MRSLPWDVVGWGRRRIERVPPNRSSVPAAIVAKAVRAVIIVTISTVRRAAMSHDGQRVSARSPYEQTVGYSRAARVGDRMIVGGTAPIEPHGGCVEDPEEQAARCLAIIVEAMAEVGAEPSDVVRTRIFMTDAADWEAIGSARSRVVGEVRPAATMIVVAALLDERWRVEIEAEAIIADSDG